MKKTVYRFGSAEEARRLFRSGALVDAIGMAFDPSSQTAAPSTIIAIKADDSVAATLNLKDANDAITIKLTASDTGSMGNRVQIKVETGSVKGKKVSTQLDDTVYSQDNIARDLFTVQYTGSQTTATVSNDGTTFSLVAGANPAITFDFAAYPRVGQLVRAINNHANWVAVAAPNARDDDTATIDPINAQSAKTTAYQVSANFQAVVDWINKPRKEGFVDASIPDASTRKLPANINWTNLAGGNDGTPVTQDWQDCFDLLKLEEVQWVVPLTGSAAVHAMADAHVNFMSVVARKNRRAVVGMDIDRTSTDDEAMTAAADAAMDLNSDRTSLLYQGHFNYSSTGATSSGSRLTTRPRW